MGRAGAQGIVGSAYFEFEWSQTEFNSKGDRQLANHSPHLISDRTVGSVNAICDGLDGIICTGTEILLIWQ